MKADLHPDYHKITVVMTDGTKYETRSCWGKEGDVLQLDVDPKTHPAWVGGVNLRKTGQMEKFNNKFAFLDKDKGAAVAKKDEQPKADAAAAPKEASAKDAEPKQAKTAKAEPKAAKAASDKPTGEKKAEKKPQADKKDADKKDNA